MKDNKLIPLVEIFLARALQLNLIVLRDLTYLRNHYYALLNLNHGDNNLQHKLAEEINPNSTLVELAEKIYLFLSKDQIEFLGINKEQVITRLIDELLPLPSTVEIKFDLLVAKYGIQTAIKWYYQFSKDSNYIKTAEIAKNQSWVNQTNYGNLEITINLSKPEKDPHEIAKEKHAKLNANQYPKCLLCIENEGYAGDLHKPARHNHRLLKLNLNQQDWYFQYSPYLYYPEHSIIINHRHQEMVINKTTLLNFFAFTKQFPHYLIGSNSDIPIIGGSILSHDHYQAGNHIFPIEKASIKFAYAHPDFPYVGINYLNWPVSTLQLIGSEHDLLLLGTLIVNCWYHYANPELEIIPFSESGVRHNGITPILRKCDTDHYKMYLLLRNNRTNKEHPDGIFHPYQNLHHIKKENIGLIEAMGLAILPGRLANELLEIEKLLLLNDENLALAELLFDETLHKHEIWLQELYQKYQDFSPENIKEILQQEVTNKFCLVLENSGVFKHNPESDTALLNFLQNLSN